MGTLPLTDSVDASTLLDETANGRIFVRHVARLTIGDLSSAS